MGSVRPLRACQCKHADPDETTKQRAGRLDMNPRIGPRKTSTQNDNKNCTENTTTNRTEKETKNGPFSQNESWKSDHLWNWTQKCADRDVANGWRRLLHSGFNSGLTSPTKPRNRPRIFHFFLGWKSKFWEFSFPVWTDARSFCYILRKINFVDEYGISWCTQIFCRFLP